MTMSRRGSHPIVSSTVRAPRVSTGAVLFLALVLGCGGGNGGGSGTAGSGNGGSAGTGTAGTTGSGGTGVCAVACTNERTCCGGGCVNLQNDPFNCGVCGRRCEGGTPYCGDGTCQQPPCNPQTELCAPNSFCCGNTCCLVGDICCEDQGPISVAPNCYTPTAAAPTCPQGCAPLCKSDRNQKKNVTPADTDAILKKVGELPISTWTYLDEPSAVRHLGPMAQDFHASFGLGNDDRTYHSVDAHGVALAAIQALEHVVKQQEQRIDKLERENRALGQRLRALDGRNQTGRERR
jgi:endosialidase-like protein/stigma-specific protein Stig1